MFRIITHSCRYCFFIRQITRIKNILPFSQLLRQYRSCTVIKHQKVSTINEITVRFVITSERGRHHASSFFHCQFPVKNLGRTSGIVHRGEKLISSVTYLPVGFSINNGKQAITHSRTYCFHFKQGWCLKKQIFIRHRTPESYRIHRKYLLIRTNNQTGQIVCSPISRYIGNNRIDTSFNKSPVGKRIYIAGIFRLFLVTVCHLRSFNKSQIGSLPTVSRVSNKQTFTKRITDVQIPHLVIINPLVIISHFQYQQIRITTRLIRHLVN